MSNSTMDSNENEERLKQEVKYLVSKLMQAKQKLNDYGDDSHLEYTVKRAGRKPSPFPIRRSLAYPSHYDPGDGKYSHGRNMMMADYGY